MKVDFIYNVYWKYSYEPASVNTLKTGGEI